MNPTPTPPVPLAELTRRAIRLLARELGAADTARFLGQFTSGSGDYVQERQAMFAGRTLAQIVGEIKAARPPSDLMGPADPHPSDTP